MEQYYVADDLDAVITYGSEVFNKHPLCKNYIDLWTIQAQWSKWKSKWSSFGCSSQRWIHMGTFWQSDAPVLSICISRYGWYQKNISGGRDFPMSVQQIPCKFLTVSMTPVSGNRSLRCYGANDTNGLRVWTAKDILLNKSTRRTQKMANVLKQAMSNSIY